MPYTPFLGCTFSIHFLKVLPCWLCVFCLYLLILLLTLCVFVCICWYYCCFVFQFHWYTKTWESCGREWKKVSFLQLWQNPFPWRIGICYREDSEHIWQCLLFPFPCQSHQGIFLCIFLGANVDHPKGL